MPDSGIGTAETGGIVATLLAALAFVGRWLVRQLNTHGEENRKRIASLEDRVLDLSNHERECLQRVAELERRCSLCRVSPDVGSSAQTDPPSE